MTTLTSSSVRFLACCLIIVSSLIEDSWQCSSKTSGGCNSHEGGGISTLKVVQILFRHGDRAPIFTYPTDPYKDKTELIWSVKRGELTRTGIEQLQEAGGYFRNRYDGFISSSYSSDEVYTTSSNVDRSISSAIAFLNGLFPYQPLGFSTVPVHVIPTDKDNKIHFSAPYLKCPAYNIEVHELNKTLHKKYSEDDRKLFRYLSKHTGIHFSSWMEVYRLHDTLYIQDLYDLKLPQWSHKVYPGILGQVARKTPAVTLASKRLTQFRGGPLLSLMLNRLRKNPNFHKSDKENAIKAKVYLYSGHESTIAALQSALGVYQDHIPPYAASFIMELHSPPKGKCGRDYIQVLYRNDSSREPYPLEIPGCKHPCYFEKLKESRADFLFSGDWDWDEKCHQVENNLLYEFDFDCSCDSIYGFNHLSHGIKIITRKAKDRLFHWVCHWFSN